METKILKIDSSNIDSAKIKQAAKLVDEGALVVLPTETVYGIACKVDSDALCRLNGIKNRSPEKYYTLHIADKKEVQKYVPKIGLRGKKLIEKAWPGPVTIIFELSEKDMEKQRQKLEKNVFNNLYKDNSIGIRCPADAVAAMLLQLTENPIVAPSANITGQPPAVNARQAIEALSGHIEMILDAGQTKYQKSSSVVKIGRGAVEILRHGVYSQEQLELMMQVNILFLCTGNTCRSPMAEGIFKKYLAEKIGCKVDQLSKKGYKVSSAGTMDMAGFPASPESIRACAAKGIDIKAHKSRKLDSQLVRESDLIFAMTGMHREYVVGIDKEAAKRCFLLADDSEILDPIGQSQSFYNSCADLMENAIIKRVSELVI